MVCLFCFSVTHLLLRPHFSCQQVYNFECIKTTVRFFKEILLFFSLIFLYDSNKLTNFMHSQGKCLFSIVEKNAKRHVKLYLRNVLWGKGNDAAPIIISNFHFLKQKSMFHTGIEWFVFEGTLKVPHGQRHLPLRPGWSKSCPSWSWTAANFDSFHVWPSLKGDFYLKKTLPTLGK